MKSVFLIAIVAVAMIGMMVPSAFAYTITDDATGGDCSTFGTWDSAIKTCTLSGDLTEGIIIGSNYLTLDGNGHKITGSGTGNDAEHGISLNAKTGINNLITR